MQSSLRRMLVESNAAAAAVALLLLWSLDGIFYAGDRTVREFAPLAATAIAIRGVPFMSLGDRIMARQTAFLSGEFLLDAAICLSLAWLLSRWAYGVGPLSLLGIYRKRLLRRNHA